jgi:hypothetical protein
MTPTQAEFLQIEASSLAKSATEAAPLLADLGLMRDALGVSAGLYTSAPEAHIFQITIATRDAPMFADALWMPEGDWFDVDNKAPFAMCGLVDSKGLHLMLGVQGQHAAMLDGLTRNFVNHSGSGQASSVLGFAMHCISWGTHYTYLTKNQWASLDRDLQDKLLDNLAIVPFARGAFFGGDAVRVPFVRVGNGWF